MGLLDQQHCLYDYLQAVWVPLLEQVSDFTGPFKTEEPSDMQKEMIEFLIRLNAKGVDSVDPFLMLCVCIKHVKALRNYERLS